MDAAASDLRRAWLFLLFRASPQAQSLLRNIVILVNGRLAAGCPWSRCSNTTLCVNEASVLHAAAQGRGRRLTNGWETRGEDRMSNFHAVPFGSSAGSHEPILGRTFLLETLELASL